VRIRAICALLAIGCLCACEPRPTISGSATVVDGDSLEIGATSVRLHAVDAPEGRQSCRRDGVEWRCGESAARKLRDLVGTRTIVCTEKDVDTYGRTVAVCTNGTDDLSAEMVRAGLALAYRQYGDDYVTEEADARAAHRGLWGSEFTPPWDWRRNPRPEPRSTAPATESPSGDCSIKGNISENGRIYHVPGSRSYEDTVINESRGERWFCTEQQAQAAGWRAPRER
jgi:endonuclease YncB( thermonuclease family)